MTEVGRGVTEGLCCEGGWVWAPDQVWGDGSWGRVSEAARGRFPLGGGNDEERGGGNDGKVSRRWW